MPTLTVGGSNAGATSFGSSITVAYTPTAGDGSSTIVGFTVGGSLSTFADNVSGSPNSYALQASALFNSGGHTMRWFDCQNFKNSGGGSVNFTYTPTASTVLGLVIVEIATGSGSGIYPAIDTSANAANQALTTTGNSPSITAAGSNEIGLAVIGCANIGTSLTFADAGGWNDMLYVGPGGTTDYPLGVSATTINAAGATNDVFTWTGSINAALFTIAYKASGSGGGGSSVVPPIGSVAITGAAPVNISGAVVIPHTARPRDPCHTGRVWAPERTIILPPWHRPASVPTVLHS